MKIKPSFKFISLNIVWLWLLLFAMIPYLMIFIASILQHDQTHLLKLPLTLVNYVTVFNPLYFKIFNKSFYLAGTTTLLCLIIGYPFAYFLARANPNLKGILLLFVILPFWTSSLIRSYAMIAILKTKGLLNAFLLMNGIIHAPLQILYTNIAVLIGLVYNLLPFMILPLYANIERLDHRLVDAAKDLGANRIITFIKIILPLTLPGIMAGCIIVFLPAMTLFYIPDLLGGAKSMLLGNLIQEQFLFANNWPLGSAISVILTLIMALMIWYYWRHTNESDRQDLI